MRADGFVVLGAFLGGTVLGQEACVSSDKAAALGDAGISFDGAADFEAGFPEVEASLPPFDAGVPDTSLGSLDSSEPDTSTNGDAAPQAVVLESSLTTVAAEGNITLTVQLNGVTASSVEIDDGTKAIATLTAAPFTTQVPLTFLDNGTHSYSAKVTLASSQVMTSAPVVVTVAIAANGFFVDPVAGSDTANSGAQGSPFKTIDKAVAALSADGQSIYLAAGTYDSTTQTNMHFTFTHVTKVRGLAPGVILTGIASQGNGNALYFATGGEARNVAIHSQYGGINVQTGAFYASSVTFDDVSDAIYIQGTSVTTIDETGVAAPFTHPRAAGLGALATDGGSVVTFLGGGGTFDPAALTTTAVFVRGHSTLTMSDFTINHCGGNALVLDDNGHVTFNDVVIQNTGSTAILMGGENTEVPANETLAISGGGITATTGTAIGLSLYGTTPETPTITLTNTHLDSNTSSGLLVSGTVTNASLSLTLNISGTTFDSNGVSGISAPRATLTMTGGTVSNNTGAGIQLTDPASTNGLKVRGTAFAANGADSIDFNGAVASTLDLGKTGDPGGLVFTTVPAKFSALNVETVIAGSAIGNTWVASQQGADATGKYTTSPTTLTTSGTNVTVVAGASVVVD